MSNKVTIESIINKIRGESYIVLPDGRTTVCQLTMENGYSINGTSACVDAANFDMNIGRRFAFEDALRQIWPLEGYLLAERLFIERTAPAPSKAPKAAPFGVKKDGTPKKRPGRAPGSAK